MFVFAPPQQSVVPVWGAKEEYFPVRRIYCVGRNYATHDLEMGGTGKTAPFFFAKPTDAVFPIADNEVGRVPYPPMTAELHHEVELVAAIGTGGANIPVEQAMEHVWGWAVAIDLTRRDLQSEAKLKGRPWETAKAFDCSAPISAIRPVAVTEQPVAADLWLYVNNRKIQAGNTRDMTCSTAQIIAEISRYWTLMPGDLILTGTPSGVSTLVRGDTVEAGVNGVGTLKFTLV